jgi:hypothetical protein
MMLMVVLLMTVTVAMTMTIAQPGLAGVPEWCGLAAFLLELDTPWHTAQLSISTEQNLLSNRFSLCLLARCC